MGPMKPKNSNGPGIPSHSDLEQIGAVYSASNIPGDLKQHDQWVLWIGDLVKGKIKKTPYQTGFPYSPANIKLPSTFSSFRCAFDRLIEQEEELRQRTLIKGCEGAFGLLFALTDQDPYVGIDLDNVIDLKTGEISNFAIDIIEKMESYTEWSPSGNGIRIFAKGELPGPGINTRTKDGHQIEMYDRARFLSVTGNVYR